MAKLYLAGPSLEWLRLSKQEKDPSVIVKKLVRRGLFSYYYDGFQRRNRPSHDITEFARLGMDVFLDSGAFTAFSKKVEIPLKMYAEFCVEHQKLFTVMSSLDAIGSGEEAARQSYENFRALRALGANVTPVWHVREPDHWLERYISEGEPEIFLGGMVPETNKWLLERLDGLFRTVLTDETGAPRARYHGFGVTAWNLMARYPWHSVDSTAWVVRAGYGMLVAPMGNRYVDITMSTQSPKRFEKNSWHINCMTEPQVKYIADWLDSFGLGFSIPLMRGDHDKDRADEIKERFAGLPTGLGYRLRTIANAITYQTMEQRIPARFDKPVVLGLFDA